MGEQFLKILESIIVNPQEKIMAISPFSEQERYSINNYHWSSPIKEVKSTDFIKPRNLTEESLLKIWQEVLNLEDISIDDNFFELGGTSQKVLQVIDKVTKKLLIDLPLRNFFANPTLADLAATIEHHIL
jgi:acyl carrier protein